MFLVNKKKIIVEKIHSKWERQKCECDMQTQHRQIDNLILKRFMLSIAMSRGFRFHHRTIICV